jgi:pimeloyl-[acyl-carrier protein] methyl ester esterase
VAPSVFGEFAEGLRRDYRRTVERFLALEAMGSDHAQTALRELKEHVFERGEPSVSVLCDGLAILDRADLRAAVGQLAVPSLWIAGRRDRLIPAAAMRWAAAHAPQGRYLEFSAGHAPFIGHAVDVAAAIAAFAQELPGV